MTTHGAAGVLDVELLRADGLLNTEVFSKQDPYAVLQVGGHSQRSKTSEDGGKNPVWNQLMTFNVTPFDAELVVTIRNQNSLVDDYDIGTCRISLQTARQTGSETIKAKVLDPKGKKRGKLHLRLVWKPAGGALPPAAASNAMHSNAGVPAKPVVAPVGFSQPLQPLQPMQMQGIHMQPMQMQGMAGMQPMQMVASMMSQVMQQMPAAAGGAAVGYGSFGTVAPPPGGAYPAAPPPAQQQYAAEGFLSQPAPAPYGQPPPAAYGPPAPAPYGQPPPAAYGQAAPAPYGQPGPGYPQPQAAYGQPPPAPAQYAAQGFLSQPAPATYGAPAAAPYAGQLMPPAAAGYPGASDPYAKQPPAAPGYGGW